MTTNKAQYVPVMTGLRAIAAYLVFVHHYTRAFDTRYYEILQELYIGVNIFFVLSGFMIAYNYANHTTIDLKKFYINRFARIYPIYFILSVLSLMSRSKK